MKLPNFDFVQAAAVRRAVVPEGDIREDIAFQNDINGLLARFDATTPPLTALGWIQEPVTPPSLLAPGRGASAPQSLRIIRGGLGLRVKTHDHDVADVVIDWSPVAVASRR